MDHAAQKLTEICDMGFFLYVGFCSDKLAIGDYRAAAKQGLPRYAALITPGWVQDRKGEPFWTSETLFDSATTGEMWSELRRSYMCGGLEGPHIELAPGNSEIHVAQQV